MKKTLLIMLIVFCLLVSACDLKKYMPGNDETKDPVAVSVIIGNRQCVPWMDIINTAEIKDAISDSVEAEGYLSCVVLDGSPTEIWKQHLVQSDELKNANSTMKKTERKKTVDSILGELAAVQADDPEADTLAALNLAVRSLKSSGIDKRRILVIDSGLSTSGVLDFHNNLITADPETLAEMLMQRKEIPDFSGVIVEWFLLGDVISPQDDLNAAQKDSLREIWKTIVEKGGGTVVFKENNPDSFEPRENLPDVSALELPDSTPIVFEKCDLVKEENPFREPVVLGESQIKFIGNTADYSDPSTALSVISEIADYMNTHPSFRILLCGTTAGDSQSEFSRELSMARAEAVKSTLIELGVSEDRILTRGLGSQNPWHIKFAGTGNDPMASANRRVVLMDADTDLARELLS